MHRRWVQATFVHTGRKLAQQQCEGHESKQPATYQLQSQLQQQSDIASHKADHASAECPLCHQSYTVVNTGISKTQQATQSNTQSVKEAVGQEPSQHYSCSHKSCNDPLAASATRTPSPTASVQSLHHQQQQQTVAQDHSCSKCSCTPDPQSAQAHGQQTGSVQHQEWEQGGSTPDVEQLTGSLFNDDTLEEVCIHLWSGMVLIDMSGCYAFFTNLSGIGVLEHPWLQNPGAMITFSCWQS